MNKPEIKTYSKSELERIFGKNKEDKKFKCGAKNAYECLLFHSEDRDLTPGCPIGDVYTCSGSLGYDDDRALNFYFKNIESRQK